MTYEAKDLVRRRCSSCVPLRRAGLAHACVPPAATVLCALHTAAAPRVPTAPRADCAGAAQINGLLQKAPHQRLPMGRRGVAAVREHVWFKGFAWDALREGRLKAPHVPKLRDADDMRFFADCEDENPGGDYGAYTSVGNFSDY